MSNGPCEALGKGIGVGRPYGRAHHTYAFRTKHLIKRPRVLGVAVMDEEPDPCHVILHRQVTGLLGDLPMIYVPLMVHFIHDEPGGHEPTLSAVFCRIARALFSVAGDTMVLLHGFLKKSQKMPATGSGERDEKEAHR